MPTTSFYQRLFDRAKAIRVFALNFDGVIGRKETQSLAQSLIRLSEYGSDEVARFLQVERTDHGLNRTDRSRCHRQSANTEREQCQRLDRTPRHLAAHREIDSRRPRLLNHKV